MTRTLFNTEKFWLMTPKLQFKACSIEWPDFSFILWAKSNCTEEVIIKSRGTEWPHANGGHNFSTNSKMPAAITLFFSQNWG